MLIRLFEDHGLVAVINGARIKKFLRSEFDVISLKKGAEEPGLQKLLPPNTHLVIVPAGKSPTSVAKTLVSRCNAVGDDGLDDFTARRIPVTVRFPYLLANPLSLCRAYNSSLQVP